MHYHDTQFGIKRDGVRQKTIKPQNADDKIEPSSKLSALDIEGVNTAYPDEVSCDERRKRVTIDDINLNGTPGSELSDETVGNGWSDAEPIMINGRVTHMMLLNSRSSYAKVRSVNPNGTLGREVYTKEWKWGWADLEMYYADNTTYILHQKRAPLLNVGGIELDPLPKEQGFTRISKVQKDAPFGDGNLGEKVYEKTWGRGWTVTKFFSVGQTPFVFCYNSETGKAKTYKINEQNPFADNRLGEPAYNDTWRKDWNIIRFFKMAGKTYGFLLSTPTGRVKIYEMTPSGMFGARKFDGDWRAGWDNVSFFNDADGNAYFITIKSSNGQVNYHRFKRDNPFSSQTPYEVIANTTWTKGWTHSTVYNISAGNKLLLLKR